MSHATLAPLRIRLDVKPRRMRGTLVRQPDADADPGEDSLARVAARDQVLHGAGGLRDELRQALILVDGAVHRRGAGAPRSVRPAHDLPELRRVEGTAFGGARGARGRNLAVRPVPGRLDATDGAQ